jgi:hypothetical protein
MGGERGVFSGSLSGGFALKESEFKEMVGGREKRGRYTFPSASFHLLHSSSVSARSSHTSVGVAMMVITLVETTMVRKTGMIAQD